jgi:hypothetical protein
MPSRRTRIRWPARGLLGQQPGILQSVLTGNLRQVAITKLQAFDLDRYIDFEIGALATTMRNVPSS